MADLDKPRKTKGKPMAGAVYVLCKQCRTRGATNKALGFKQGQLIEACRNCR